MGVSTDAKLCYGIELDEGEECPWTNENSESGEEFDIEMWWAIKHGFPKYEDYTEPDKNYYTELDIFIDKNPLPVELVRHCSADFELYILSVPGTEITANRGYPEKINISELVVITADEKKFLDFCKEYIPDFDPNTKPGWLLCSWWG